MAEKSIAQLAFEAAMEYLTGQKPQPEVRITSMRRENSFEQRVEPPKLRRDELLRDHVRYNPDEWRLPEPAPPPAPLKRIVSVEYGFDPAWGNYYNLLWSDGYHQILTEAQVYEFSNLNLGPAVGPDGRVNPEFEAWMRMDRP